VGKAVIPQGILPKAPFNKGMRNLISFLSPLIAISRSAQAFSGFLL
jgi:hypothetical protein